MELSNRVIFALFVLLIVFFCIKNNDTMPIMNGHGLLRGEVLTVTGKGAMIRCNEGQFWVSERLLSSNSLKGDSLVVFGSINGTFIKPFSVRVKQSTSFFSRIRCLYRDVLFNTIPDTVAAGLTGGILMGLRGMIPVDIALVFKNSGTSHLLALSGLHTGIVVLTLAFFVRLVFGKKTISTWITVVGIFIFVALSGGRASTVRAGIMASFILLWFAYRGGRIHLLSLWWITLLLSLVFIPATLFDKGAQMSYGAVLSLILFGKQFKGKFGNIYSIFFAGIVVTIALAPLMISIYNGFALQGPIATVISMPFMYLVMILGLLTSIGVSFLALPLEFVVMIWIKLLSLFDQPLITIQPIPLYFSWGLLLLLLRILLKWNHFNKRLR